MFCLVVWYWSNTQDVLVHVLKLGRKQTGLNVGYAEKFSSLVLRETNVSKRYTNVPLFYMLEGLY